MFSKWILFIFYVISPTLIHSKESVYLSSVQEKAYLHLDNNCYFAGDTIWYKAYVVRADDHRPTDMSRILYVELLNEQGYLMERQQLVVDDDGQAHGQFAIADSAWAGYYEVRAYTKWMLNWGENAMFSRVVPMYEKPDSVENYRRKVMPRKVTAGEYTVEYPLPKLSIALYPEGGHLVYGLPSRVAFEVTNEETRRLNLSGTLWEDGRELQKIHCLHAGRGVFQLTPRKGCQYKVKFELNGTIYEKELGTIEDEGSVIEVNMTGERIGVTLRHVGRRITEKRKLLVSCRGRQEVCFHISAGEVESHYALSMDSLNSGVHDITLTDSLGRTLLRRKVFVYPQIEEMAPCRVTFDKRDIVSYGKMEMDLDLGAAVGEQRFSVSVTDKSQRDASYSNGNIQTELLLQSDIRGFVEDAAWYFEHPDDEKRAALDLLLMVQGWSRYDWDGSQYEAEKTPSLSGRMTDIHARIWQHTKGRKALFASLFLKNDSVFDTHLHERTYLFRGAMYADSLDRFRIEYEPFTGEGILQLRGYYADKLGHRNYDKLLHDPHILIRLDNFFPDYLKQYSWYEMNRPSESLSEEAGSDPYSILLDEVVVKSAKRRYSRFRMEPVVSYDFNDLLNEFWDKYYLYDETHLFTNQQYDIENVMAYLEWKVMRRNYVDSLARVGILADGNYVDRNHEAYLDFLATYSYLHRIDSVQIITDAPCRPTYYRTVFPVRHQVGGITSAVVGYVNFQKYPEDQERFIEGRYIRLHGFNRPAEFYSPDYSRIPLPEKPDHRHTLYWNPTIKTDSEGRAHIEFYNSSSCTDIDVKVEGITKDGKFIINE